MYSNQLLHLCFLKDDIIQLHLPIFFLTVNLSWLQRYKALLDTKNLTADSLLSLSWGRLADGALHSSSFDNFQLFYTPVKHIYSLILIFKMNLAS